MRILYKHEHVTCNNFRLPTQRTFQVFHLHPEEKCMELDNSRSILLLFWKEKLCLVMMLFTNRYYKKKILH